MTLIATLPSISWPPQARPDREPVCGGAGRVVRAHPAKAPGTARERSVPGVSSAPDHLRLLSCAVATFSYVRAAVADREPRRRA
ncbi:hypothetical protein [Microbispora sp. H10830]|uniref:hypothetical protein n=1 Tax=Microbispora sp. H10830 TaxID=2729109 RepID=UPI0016023502|nr:hypothetical protein [Microbispora sp. H10830]